MDELKLSTIFDLMKKDDEREYGLELLYKHHARLLFSTAYSVCQNEEDCKDIVQNVLFKLSKLSKGKLPTSGELSWIYRVVKNEAINYIKREKSHLDIESVSEIPIVDQEIYELIDMDNYYSMIASLNDKQKEVVTLKVLGDFSHREIAEMLNKPVGTIQWIYNTSVKKLRIVLATLATVLVANIGGLFYRVNRLLNKGDGDFSIASENTEIDFSQILSDQTMIILGLLLMFGVITTIVIYKNSDKIPTK